MLAYVFLSLSVVLMVAAFIALGYRILVTKLRSKDKMLSQMTFLVVLAVALVCASASGVTESSASDDSIVMFTAPMVLMFALVGILGAAATFGYYRFRLQYRTARKYTKMMAAYAERSLRAGCVMVRDRTVDVTHSALAFLPRRSA